MLRFAQSLSIGIVGALLLAAAVLAGIAIEAPQAFADDAAAQPLACTTMGGSGTGDALEAASPEGPVTVEERLSNVDVKVKPKVQNVGWKATVKSGKVAGTTTRKGLRALKMKLIGLNGVSGSIHYKAYVPGEGWKVGRNGKTAGSNVRAMTGLRIWLAGKLSKYYDVYYRVHVTDYKWLDWAKNKQIAGTLKQFAYVNAVQVKLVKKGAKFKGATAVHHVKNRWQAIERQYANNNAVKQILEVKYTGNSKAKFELRKKKGSSWETALSCTAYVGRKGIGPAREGLSRTPSGDFGITDAFGIKSDPGANIPYVKVTNAMYWCGDRAYYNQLVNINEHPHDCAGEHLIDYAPHYNYGLFFDYNTNPIKYGAGSAFFVHCTGGTAYTGGCIAVSQTNMVKIIRSVTDGARICIYSK